MRKLYNYFKFLRENGKPLSEINPGSDETYLTVENALQALEILKETQTPIIGGDILSENNNKLGYAIHLWGYEYCHLIWACDSLNDESKTDYFHRSYNKAKESILKAESAGLALYGEVGHSHRLFSGCGGVKPLRIPPV